MPNRIIKESACTSDTLAEISADAERLWWRLVVQADDYGCFDGRPNVILGKCLTAFIGRFTDADVDGWLNEMEQAELIERYTVEGRPYIHLRKWGDHQRPARAKEPKYKLPSEADTTCGQSLSNDSKRQQETANAPVVGIRSREAGGGNVRAREGAQQPPTAAEMIEDDNVPPLVFYENVFGVPCPHTSIEVIDEFESKGLDPSALKWAIREQRESDGRGPKYLRSIMTRLHDNGLKTSEDAQGYEQQRREPTRSPPQQDSDTPTPLDFALKSAREQLAQREVASARDTG